MQKRTIKINIKLPSGMPATDSLIKDATNAAKKVVEEASSSVMEAQELAKELASRGIDISAGELLKRMSRTKTKRAGKTFKTPRKRVVLSGTKRKALIADLKAAMTIKNAAKKYGIATATVMGIKSKAGLTKKRKK